MRLACRLTDLPVEVLAGCAATASCVSRRGGGLDRPAAPARRGLQARDPASWPVATVTTTTQTTRYGTAVAHAWDQLHPRLTHRSAWLGHDAACPSSTAP